MGDSYQVSLLSEVIKFLASQEFMSWAGTILGIALLTCFKRVRELIGKVPKNVRSIFGRKKHALDRNITSTYDIINSELINIRLLADAARATVWQFHNGETFSLSTPVFKIRSTFEQCHYGVAPDNTGNEPIVVSKLMELIGPLLDHERKVNGIEDITPDPISDDTPIRFLRVTHKDLPFCKTKYMMSTNGIDHAYVTLLTSTDNRPIGVLTVQYLTPESICKDERDNILHEIHDAVQTIQFALDKTA